MAAEIWSTSDRTFCYFDHFVSFSPFFCPNNSDNQNFEKMKKEKKTWRYYHFTHVYHKWQSYDEWFLRYGMQWTVDFWQFFCPFFTLTTQRIWSMIPEIWSATDRTFCHFGSFFALLPPLKTWKIKILKK